MKEERRRKFVVQVPLATCVIMRNSEILQNIILVRVFPVRYVAYNTNLWKHFIDTSKQLTRVHLIDWTVD